MIGEFDYFHSSIMQTRVTGVRARAPDRNCGRSWSADGKVAVRAEQFADLIFYLI